MAQLPFSPNEQRILKIMAQGFKDGLLSDYYIISGAASGIGFFNMDESKEDYQPFEDLIYVEKVFGQAEIEKFKRFQLLNHVTKDAHTFDSQAIINLVDTDFISTDSLLNPENFQIVISYSRTQKSFVEQLAQYLQLGYKRTWYDKEIPGGDNWWATIQKKIKESNLIVFAVSKSSLASTYCQQELDVAREANRPLIPVRLTNIGDQEVSLNEVPSALAELQVIDIDANSPDALGLSKLFGAIIRRAW